MFAVLGVDLIASKKNPILTIKYHPSIIEKMATAPI
jgi:hypothetical protein